MTVYAYRALSPSGAASTGTLAAESRAAAVAELAGRGLHPLEISEEQATAVRRAHADGHKGRVSQKSVEAFTRELANLLAGGVPLSRALSLLKREASHPAAKHLWGQVHDAVVGGASLADTLAKFPQAFSSIYVAMVRAGEAGGFLEVVLNQIAEFRTRESDLDGKVKAALVYPCVLAVMAAVTLIFLLTSFIPRFAPLFAQFGSALPPLTRWIIDASDLIKSYGLFIAAGLVVLAIVARRVLATDAGRRQVEHAVLAMPLLGGVVGHFALVRFCRMLGTLIGAGVPLITALRTAKEAIGNQTLADTVGKGIEEVQRGAPLARSLALSPQLFPPSVVEMVAVAEETGRLDKELVRLAASYESDLDRKLRMLVSLAEPLLLVIMAVLIGTIVIGMLLPIFNL
ncbi:MAG: type II secretion system F family protein, partial [Phycisphaerae bacterium]